MDSRLTLPFPPSHNQRTAFVFAIRPRASFVPGPTQPPIRFPSALAILNKMRASSSVMLASALCGASLFLAVPVISEKVYHDLRGAEDYGSYANCGTYTIFS